jgi:4-hydroxy-tetrahydrodipicolinate synthase
MHKFGRLLTAMVTPFDADGKVDYTQAKRLTKALFDSGTEGIVVAGSTGESATLSHEEKLRLFYEIKSEAGKQGTVIAGTGTYSTNDSIELTKEAEKIGVDGCLLVVPYYNKPTQEGLYQHFKKIAESTALPCILYNVPSRTITNLNLETMLSLSKVENIIGLKESSSNFEQIARLIDATGEKFLVYSGNDSDTIHVLTLGGYGTISVASHLVGLQIKQMIDCFIDGDARKAAQIHRNLLPLVNSLFVVANPMPVKYALNYLGFTVGTPRLPLTEPDEKVKALIQETLKCYKIDLPIANKPR